jgi:hypothetical protein
VFLTKKQMVNFDADEKPKAAAEKFTPASTTAKGSPAATLASTAGAGKGPKIVCVGSGGERKGGN